MTTCAQVANLTLETDFRHRFQPSGHCQVKSLVLNQVSLCWLN